VSSTPLQIAIDGPAASGKTTVARLLARRMRVPYLDTGSMYRALAYEACRARTDPSDGDALLRLAHERPISVGLGNGESQTFFLDASDGTRFTDAMLQSRDVTERVSTVAAQPQVRRLMVQAQRRAARGRSLIVAGRDIGTVVLPDAPVKIFLTASVAARVERRRRQLEGSGIAFDAARLTEDIERRDRLDQTRDVSPLEPAPDAHVVDSSDLTAEQVVDAIVAIARRGGST
jgi:cytidylate kinase